MRITSEAFKQLGEDDCAFCAPDHLGRVAGNDQVRVLLYGDAASARGACSVQLANYLHGHDTQLVAFIEKHLVGELAFWFGEELKADRPESNRAWRAFQRLLLEGLQTALTDMRAEQQEMRQALDGVREDLRAWAGRMEALPQESRESTGESALANVLTEARDQLLAAIATESGLTRTAVETGVEQIARLLREELVIPAMTVCGLVERAKWFVDYYIKDEFGLRGIAAADMLGLLVDEDAMHILTKDFYWAMRGTTTAHWAFLREALAEHPIDQRVLDLHWTVSERHSWRALSMSQFDDAIADLIELSSAFSNASLIGLHLLHKGKHGGPTWDSDHVKALLAAKTVPFYTTSAWRFIPLIEDQEVRDLALTELYGRLPLEVVAQGGGISQDRLRAIAFLRASARETDPDHKRGFLDEAFALARNSIENADEFTLDLLIEFVREA